MSTRFSKRKYLILKEFKDYYEKHFYYPTYLEIGQKFGVSKQAIYQHVLSLKKIGYLEYTSAPTRNTVLTLAGYEFIQKYEEKMERWRKENELINAFRSFKNIFPSEYKKIFITQEKDFQTKKGELETYEIETSPLIKYLYGEFKVIKKGSKLISIEPLDYFLMGHNSQLTEKFGVMIGKDALTNFKAIIFMKKEEEND